ncbi:hypothetical protein I7I53_06565 [Histoplasma capsulatum var. duboisii H88]|uniref:Uncharacterized protein n=1 Tax=Ajellomyces capsulatus (strain H88) TaxID=544711 RepID=A0A8A1LEI0_AJEC8|nr:hypothetical protein I7I53_06565 [Histoplasma capsulatum var. duboisii H88]
MCFFSCITVSCYHELIRLWLTCSLYRVKFGKQADKWVKDSVAPFIRISKTANLSRERQN